MIATARLVLAIFTFVAISLDPSEPAQYYSLTYSLLLAYCLYSLILAAAWKTTPPNVLLLATHVTDIAVFAVLQYLTLGPTSPFFVYFVFALFSGALRWGLRGLLGTTAAVLAAFLVTGVYMSRTVGPAFELNRFIIRGAYLFVVAGLLAYLGHHETRMRMEIEQLARWPRISGPDAASATERLLRHALDIVRTPSAVLVWEAQDEPWLHVAACSPSSYSLVRHPPTRITSAVAEELIDATFLCTIGLEEVRGAVVRHGAGLTQWRGTPVHDDVRALLPQGSVISAPFKDEHVSGRVFFGGLRRPAPEALPLAEVVARELGASIDQMYSGERERQLAVSEERIRLARDLHDGVLQALTGVRLEIRNVATDVERTASPTLVRDRLLAIERAIALEQRELRTFISTLRPYEPAPQGRGSVAASLGELVDRFERQWRIPVTLRIAPPDVTAPDDIGRTLPLIIHEALVNAARHGHPSRISVDVSMSGLQLQITIADDGGGFSFHGRLDEGALARDNAGPVSLRERVTAMGGTLTVDSSAAGARLEIRLPSAAPHT